MADNFPVPDGAPKPPPLSANVGEGSGGSLSVNPPAKKSPVGKVVVLLSSVAKAPPAVSQPIVSTVTSEAFSGQIKKTPPPLPLKPSLGSTTPRRLNLTTHVKLPPKGGTSRWPSFAGAPVGTPSETKQDAPASTPSVSSASLTPVSKATPPPLPAKARTPDLPKTPEMHKVMAISKTIEPPKTEIKKVTAKLIPPIKLNQPSVDKSSTDQSIFADNPEPEPVAKDWKELQPGELGPLAADMDGINVFARSENILPQPNPPTTVPKIVEKTDVAVTPASGVKSSDETKTPPVVKTQIAPPPAPAPIKVIRPPPLPLAKPVDKSISPPIHLAPPMIESEPGAHAAKLRPPVETDREEKPAPVVVKPANSESPTPATPLAAQPIQTKGLSPVPSTPSSAPILKVTGPIILRKAEDPKPSLRPAVLPNKLIVAAAATEAEAVKPPAESTEKTSASPIGTPLPPPLPAVGLEKSKLPSEPEAKAPPLSPAVPHMDKPPLPLTRAARSKRRQFIGRIVFYVTFVVVLAILFFGGIYFSRETSVEGQVIPPQGMPLSDEVWIVTDFRDLTAGIADDLAAERTPLLQEIQEREDHVRRAQADVAMREERIRLFASQIQTAKDSAGDMVKKARDATQQLWDGPGADLDNEYDAHQEELGQTIAARAKSLNLNYQPDDTYRSPEVWANAYRLALYDVPKGVDSVKEHQWLADQMKQWRAFVKSVDDRKEQLREQAAQIKLSPSTKMAELNSKIDALQHRIDNTQAEEDPIKVELQQAEADLAQVQATEAGLDDKYYKQLDALPGESVVKHLSLLPNGRFSWPIEDTEFTVGETTHQYWIFARATRADGREYWALHRFTVVKNKTLELMIEPGGFISTKAVLRPDLSPDEIDQ